MLLITLVFRNLEFVVSCSYRWRVIFIPLALRSLSFVVMSDLIHKEPHTNPVEIEMLAQSSACVSRITHEHPGPEFDNPSWIWVDIPLVGRRPRVNLTGGRDPGLPRPGARPPNPVRLPKPPPPKPPLLPLPPNPPLNPPPEDFPNCAIGKALTGESVLIESNVERKM